MKNFIFKKSISPDKSYFPFFAFLLNTSRHLLKELEFIVFRRRKIVKKINIFQERLLYQVKKDFNLIINYLKDKLTIDNIKIDESHKIVYRKNSTSNELFDKKERIVSKSSQLRDNKYWSGIENRYSELKKKSILQPKMIPELEEIRKLMENLNELEQRYYSPEGEKQGTQISYPMSSIKKSLSDKLYECEQKYSNEINDSSLASVESKVSEKNTIKLDRAMSEPVYQDVNFSSPDISGYDHLDHFRTNSPLLSKTQADYKPLNSVPLSFNKKNRFEGEKKSPIYENINHSLFFRSSDPGSLLLTPSNKQRIYEEEIINRSVKPHAFFSKNNPLERLQDEIHINLSPRSL